MNELSESMFDHDMRVERALHIPTMLALPSDDLEEAIKDGDLDELDRLLGLEPGTLHEAAEEEELGWVLDRATGWAIEASAPLHGPRKNGSCRIYTSMRTIRWFKGDTYEEALRLAVEWVESDPPELLYESKAATS